MNLKNDNEGVSPVIGVILMVAITVALAAGVFLLVQSLTNTNIEQHIQMGFIIDEDTLVVSAISQDDVVWGDLVVSGCNNANGPTEVVEVGDELTNCVSGATVAHNGQLVFRMP